MKREGNPKKNTEFDVHEIGNNLIGLHKKKVKEKYKQTAECLS